MIGAPARSASADVSTRAIGSQGRMTGLFDGPRSAPATLGSDPVTRWLLPITGSASGRSQRVTGSDPNVAGAERGPSKSPGMRHWLPIALVLQPSLSHLPGAP